MSIVINIGKIEINVYEKMDLEVKQELELEKLIESVNEGIGEGVIVVKDTTEIKNIPKENLANIIREIATKAAYEESQGEKE